MKIEIKIFNDRVCFVPVISFRPARRTVRAVNREQCLTGGNPHRKNLKQARIY